MSEKDQTIHELLELLQGEEEKRFQLKESIVRQEERIQEHLLSVQRDYRERDQRASQTEKDLRIFLTEEKEKLQKHHNEAQKVKSELERMRSEGEERRERIEERKMEKERDEVEQLKSKGEKEIEQLKIEREKEREQLKIEREKERGEIEQLKKQIEAAKKEYAEKKAIEGEVNIREKLAE